MDHATTFPLIHSSNGRDAAPHLQGWTSKHYMSSAQHIKEMYAPRSSSD